MPIGTITMGKHEDIPFVKFGSGDVLMSQAKYQGDSHDTLILFIEQEPHPIGHETSEFIGQTSDQMPKPGIVFQFTSPKSITALIHTLIELQKEVFEYEEQQTSKNK